MNHSIKSWGLVLSVEKLSISSSPFYLPSLIVLFQESSFFFIVGSIVHSFVFAGFGLPPSLVIYKLLVWSFSERHTHTHPDLSFDNHITSIPDWNDVCFRGTIVYDVLLYTRARIYRWNHYVRTSKYVCTYIYRFSPSSGKSNWPPATTETDDEQTPKVECE